MKKFVIIMVSITAVCLITAVVLTAVNQGNNTWDRSRGNWATAVEGTGGEVDQTQTDSLSGNGEGFTVSVRSGSDNINVHNGDGGEVRVHYHGTIRSSRRNIPVPTLKMEETANGVSFWLEHPRVVGALFYSRSTVMDVYLPASYAGNLDLDASSGNIEIEGYSLRELKCNASSGNVNMHNIDADRIDARTSSGDIKAEGLSGGAFSAKTTSGSITGGDIIVGKIDLDTSSGDMRLNGVAGDIVANASSGRIEIEEIAGAGTVNAETTSGDIQMSFTAMGPDYKLHTSSGSVKLWFPSEAAFGIVFDTNSGSFHSDFPITMTKTERNSVEGYVGSDGNSVRVQTSSGDCRINKN